MSNVHRPHRPNARRVAGFTLVELVIVMGMSAVLLAVASPSIMAVVRANRLDVATNDVRAAVMLARSEAVKRASLMIVEPVTAGSWTSGLRVYVDADQNATNAYSASTDTLVRQFSALRNITISGSLPARLAFDSAGRNVSLAASSAARVPTTVTLPLCIAPARRDLLINQTGFLSKSDASC